MKMKEKIQEESKPSDVENMTFKPRKTDFGYIIDELDKCTRYTIPGSGIGAILQRVKIKRNIKRGIKLLNQGFEMAGTDERKRGLLVDYAITLADIASGQGYYNESEKLYKMALDNYSPCAKLSKETIEKTYKKLSLEKADYMLGLFRHGGEEFPEKEPARKVFNIYLKFRCVDRIYKIFCDPDYYLYFPHRDLTVDQLQEAGILLIEDMQQKIKQGEYIGVSEWDSFLTALSEITHIAWRWTTGGINIFTYEMDGEKRYTRLGKAFKNFLDGLGDEQRLDIQKMIEKRKEMEERKIRRQRGMERKHGYSIIWKTFFAHTI